MKNTQNQQINESKGERNIFFALLLAVGILVVSVSFIIDAVTGPRPHITKYTTISGRVMEGTTEQWEEFNKCIESHPSDYVCDSCYKAIFKSHE